MRTPATQRVSVGMRKNGYLACMTSGTGALHHTSGRRPVCISRLVCAGCVYRSISKSDVFEIGRRCGRTACANTSVRSMLYVCGTSTPATKSGLLRIHPHRAEACGCSYSSQCSRKSKPVCIPWACNLHETLSYTRAVIALHNPLAHLEGLVPLRVVLS